MDPKSMCSQWTSGRGGRRRYYCKTWQPQSVWEKAAPSFHEWFWKTRSQQFKDSLTMSARQSLGIEGCFYTSGLELKYKLQKKRLWECEIPNEVADVSAELQTGSEEFCIEEARAIHGLGKDDHFYVDHWSHEVELLESREAASEKREGQNSPEPEIFADRIPDVNPPAEKISCTSPTPFKS